MANSKAGGNKAFSGRRARHKPAPASQTQPPKPAQSRIASTSSEPGAQPAQPPPDVGGASDIPDHVRQTLAEAGEEAAARLLELLQPHRFSQLPASTQRTLIELGLTRAYGLPVRRSVDVSLSSSDGDAVAAALDSLAAALPERSDRARDITPQNGVDHNDKHNSNVN